MGSMPTGRLRTKVRESLGSPGFHDNLTMQDPG